MADYFEGILDQAEEVQRRSRNDETKLVDRILREEGMSGYRVNTSPTTLRALAEIAACHTWSDFTEAVRENLIWRRKRGDLG